MKRLGPWLSALLPAGLGLGISLLLAGQPAANPILYLRADLGTLSLLLGLLASGMWLAALGLWRWHHRRVAWGQAHAQAQAADERRRFLQRLDHELKNPLTAIRAGLANLADSPEPAARREAQATVDAQVRRVSRLAADLRKLAELETRPLERSPVDLADLLQQVVDLAEDRGRRLSLVLPQAPWPLPAVQGDRDLLLLVAHNLVDNAVKFTRPEDTIEVRAFEDGASVVVQVADTGPGIPAEELPHVWSELYRGAGARGVPGSGLGLALVQAIIQRHAGQVSLRSRAGQGTVVTVRLPARG